MAVLRAAGARLAGIDVVEAHEAAWVLIMTRRALSPGEFWKSVADKHEQSPEEKRRRQVRREKHEEALKKSGWMSSKAKPKGPAT